jgi:pimeloyl-ACP methyl ester carboxylesterase
MTPIVLIPGMLCSAEVFAPQIAALWPYGPVTVASTLEGDTLAATASAILASAPPRFALCGISMGGYISLEIMRQAPDRVVKLALLDTSAEPEPLKGIAQRRALVAQARAGDFREVLKQVLPPILLHPDHQNDEALIETNVRMGVTVGVEGMARQQEAIIARADSRPNLAAITVPTLVLVGDSDLLTPPGQSEALAAVIPGSRLVVVPKCGHASTLEQPEAVNRALIEWIID